MFFCVRLSPQDSQPAERSGPQALYFTAEFSSAHDIRIDVIELGTHTFAGLDPLRRRSPLGETVSPYPHIRRADPRDLPYRPINFRPLSPVLPEGLRHSWSRAISDQAYEPLRVIGNITFIQHAHSVQHIMKAHGIPAFQAPPPTPKFINTSQAIEELSLYDSFEPSPDDF